MLFCKLSPQKQNIDRTAYQIAKYNCGAATTACFAMYIYCLLALYMLCKNKKQNVTLLDSKIALQHVIYASQIVPNSHSRPATFLLSLSQMFRVQNSQDSNAGRPLEFSCSTFILHVK